MKNEILEFTDDDLDVARRWVALAQRPEIDREIVSILSAIDAAVTARGPACWASGRCCRFDCYGHRLYTTGLEAARSWIMMRFAPAPATPAGRLPLLSFAGAGCRYQADNLCTAREARPSGCRVFFCDKSAEDWQSQLFERAIADFRSLHDRVGAPYRFAEWRRLLALLDAATP